MKHLTRIAAALAATAIAAPALAADLPARKAAPAMVAVDPPSWTGFYAGVNLGYQFRAGSTGTGALPGFFAPTWDTEMAASMALASAPYSGGKSGSFIGGGQVGYNIQWLGPLVAGLEADIQGLAGGGNGGGVSGGALIPAAFPGETIVSNSTASARVDWLGTLRGRFGYVLTPSLMAYATAGLAYGGVRSSASIMQVNLPFGGAPFTAISTGATSGTRLGFAVGGGAEWKFMRNLGLKFEYLYYDLGTSTQAMTPLVFAGPPYGDFPFQRTHYAGHIVRGGLNYHFNFGAAPVVAKY